MKLCGRVVFSGLFTALLMTCLPNLALAEGLNISWQSSDGEGLVLQYPIGSRQNIFTATDHVVIALEVDGIGDVPDLSVNGVEFVKYSDGLLVLVSTSGLLSWHYSLDDAESVIVELKFDRDESASGQSLKVHRQLIDRFKSMSFKSANSSEMQRIVVGLKPIDETMVMLSDYSDYIAELSELVARGDISSEEAVAKAEQVREALVSDFRKEGVRND